jgi:hypothetical protein
MCRKVEKVGLLSENQQHLTDKLITDARHIQRIKSSYKTLGMTSESFIESKRHSRVSRKPTSDFFEQPLKDNP